MRFVTHRRCLWQLHCGGMIIGLLLLGPLAVVGADSATSRAPTRLRFALLVGVQDYRNLDAREKLDGCRNDVAAIKKLLVRFGFPPENITALVDGEATSAAVREHLRSLVARVKALPPGGPKPQIVFYFSGHGSLMPDQPEGDPDCDKEDGVDTTIVPYDAEREGSDKDIRDDEIMHFADGICQDDRATLLVVLDCCHSGRGVRGVGKFRGLERTFAIPQPVSGGKRTVTPKTLPAGAVILSACRKAEKEPEYEEEGQSHGLMTFFLTRLLDRESAVSKVDYELLRTALTRQYQEAGVVPAPTPTVEGDSRTLRSPILAADAGMDRPPFWPVEIPGADRGIVRIEAGLPHGVTKGSLYEIYEKPEQVSERFEQHSSAKNLSVGWAQVEAVEGATSSGRTFVWDESRKEQIEQPLGRSFSRGIAVERYHHCSDIALKVRVVNAMSVNNDGPPLGPDDRSLPAVVRDALTNIRSPNESAWLTWVADKSPCDVLLRIDGNYAAIFPATGGAEEGEAPRAAANRQIPASLLGGWGPIELTQPELGKKRLYDYFWRIARVRNLLRVAATQAPGASSGVQVQMELLSVKLDKPDPQHGKYGSLTGWSPWPRDKDGALVAKNGDYLAIRVKNTDLVKKPWYVTVLLIDPDMQIQTLFPEREVIGDLEKLRVDPGDENARVTEPFVCESPFGRETVIALGTREPNSFAFLEQPALRTVKGGPRNTSELFELIVERVYFQTRGQPPRPQKMYDPSWSAATLSWDAKP